VLRAGGVRLKAGSSDDLDAERVDLAMRLEVWNKDAARLGRPALRLEEEAVSTKARTDTPPTTAAGGQQGELKPWFCCGS